MENEPALLPPPFCVFVVYVPRNFGNSTSLKKTTSKVNNKTQTPRCVVDFIKHYGMASCDKILPNFPTTISASVESSHSVCVCV